LQDCRIAGLQDCRKENWIVYIPSCFTFLPAILQFCNPAMQRVLISACLLGERVRYHGGDARLEHPTLRRWLAEGRVVPLCPEVAGGLPAPRPPAEIRLLPEGRRVLTASGDDVTSAFERGAELAVAACVAYQIRIAILKDGSPSCGSGSIHDGTFSGRRIPGVGITVARLAAAGVTVFREDQIDAAAELLAALDTGQSATTEGKERNREG
jgi:uncharacterized protein YbbK (DUF523 family)